MHELGVVFHIIDSVEEIAKENQVTGVKSVTLELGEVSTVIPHYLTDCWKWAVNKNDLMQGAALNIETIPAVTYCEDCEQTYETVRHGKRCPHCGSERTWLIQGNEFVLKEIEVTDPEPENRQNKSEGTDMTHTYRHDKLEDTDTTHAYRHDKLEDTDTTHAYRHDKLEDTDTTHAYRHDKLEDTDATPAYRHDKLETAHSEPMYRLDKEEHTT